MADDREQTTEEKIQELEKKTTASERDALVVAKARALNALSVAQPFPSVAIQEAFTKASKALADYDARLNPAEPSYANRIEALNYLKRQGFKIGKSKLYGDCKKGLLKLRDNGSILESDLKKYIRSADLQKLSETPDADPNDILIQKADAELEKLRTQNKILRLQLDEKLGKYVSRTDFDMEFAAKVGVLKQGLEHMVYTYAFEWVDLVLGADPDTAAQKLIERVKKDLEGQFNNFANLKKFQIVFGEEMTDIGEQTTDDSATGN